MTRLILILLTLSAASGCREGSWSMTRSKEPLCPCLQPAPDPTPGQMTVLASSIEVFTGVPNVRASAEVMNNSSVPVCKVVLSARRTDCPSGVENPVEQCKLLAARQMVWFPTRLLPGNSASASEWLENFPSGGSWMIVVTQVSGCP